jgi:hypothetical protein
MRTLSFIMIFFAFVSVFADNEKQDVRVSESETTQINGRVIDHLTGENLAGVKISIENSDIVAYTDLDGNFSISVPSAFSDSSLEISYISYETTKIRVNIEQENCEIKILPVAR